MASAGTKTRATVGGQMAAEAHRHQAVSAGGAGTPTPERVTADTVFR